MSTHDPIDCEFFDDNVDELALGHLDEPLQSSLLTHADVCARCHSSLESLGAVVDRLLLATPRVEPPGGFEHRVLERIPDTSTTTPRPVRRWLAAIAAVVTAFVAGGVVVATQLDRGSDHDASADVAPIVANDGRTIGSVRLTDEPVPHVVITIAAPRAEPGIRTCELRGPDGRWESIGWWDEADITSGAWAVGIDPSLLEASAMRITADGRTVGEATFD